MITNVIFDCGQVLIRYNEVEIASHFTENASDAEILGKVGMARKYWDAFDLGTLEEADYLEQVRKELPEHLHTAVEKLAKEWIMRCPSIPGMEEIVCDVKKAGKKLYLLSNFNQRLRSEQNYIPALKHFDALVISGEIKTVKPDRAIFEHLCKECNISPEETLFIDDSPKNIEGARKFGITGYLFDGDVKKLESYLEDVLKEK